MWNERQSTGALLGCFLSAHRRTALLLAGCVLIFSVVFSLYSLEVEAVWYAAALCLVPALLWGGLRFRAYVRRHRALEALGETIGLAVDRLPPPGDLLESDYQRLLLALADRAAANLAEAVAQRRELMDYYGTWAHQIKTPIAAMRLLLGEEKSALAGALEAELLEVEQYVEMALGYLRLDSQSSDFVFRDCDLEPVVRQAVRRFAPQFIHKRLALEFGPVALSVVSDEKWLLFCIEQVLSNAIKYTARGKICIYTEGSALVIADTGVGIAPEDLPRIFEKGFTGYNGRTDKKATGIGLWLCRRILDKLGHGISIDGAVGAGVTVRIDLSRRETRYE